MVNNKKPTKAEIAAWTEELRAELKPGDTLYTVLRSRSASGMSRNIDVFRFAAAEGGKVQKYWLSYRVAAICGFPYDRKRECLRINGCGMDMGFHVVYTLSRVLFEDGYALKHEWI